MNCITCGAKLPPSAASCQVCGTPTPYNVTQQHGNSLPYNSTGAASPTSYSGGNPPTPSLPYSGNPPTPSSPYSGNPPTPSYGAPPPPSTGYGTTPYDTSGTSATYLYGTPATDPYSQPGNNYGPQQPQQPQQFFSPPPAALTPPRKSGRGRIIVLAIIALVVVLVAAGIVGAVAINTQHANATSTAQTQAHHLTATSVVHQNLTATAVAIASIYPFSNNLVLNDPLSDNSKGYQWDQVTPSSTQGGCVFSGQSYHVSEPQSGFFNTCMGNKTSFTNFTYEVEMMVSKGDAGGLVFRSNSQATSFYYFRLNQDGTYTFLLYVDTSGTTARSLAHGTAPGFTTGLNQTNLLSVVAKGTTLTLYANKQEITSVTDSTYTMGEIGFAADYQSGPTEVVYTNAKVWQLP